jgi:hypothetical protein
MLGRAVNLYFITKYKNISTRKPKYRRAVITHSLTTLTQWESRNLFYMALGPSVHWSFPRKPVQMKPGSLPHLTAGVPACKVRSHLANRAGWLVRFSYEYKLNFTGASQSLKIFVCTNLNQKVKILLSANHYM